MGRKLGVVVALVGLAAAVLPSTVVRAAASVPVVRWDLNEASAKHVDSVSGLVATSGSEVQNGKGYLGATGIYLPSTTTERRLNEVMPQRLTTAPSNPLLDPGSAVWAVEIRAAWTRGYGNLIQKGQSGTKGGYFKIELPAGNVACLFRGGDGSQRAVKSPAKYDDGQWHTIRCERNADRVRLIIDGVVVRQNIGKVGKIQNSWQLTIAGKGVCDQVSVSCDYYDGRIDYVLIQR